MAMVLGYGDGDHGIDEDLFLAQGGTDGGFEIGGEEAVGEEALLEHGEGEVAIGADADGAAQLRGIVDGDGDEIVFADGLGGQVGTGFGDGASGRLRQGGGKGEQYNKQDTHRGTSTVTFGNH